MKLFALLLAVIALTWGQSLNNEVLVFDCKGSATLLGNNPLFSSRIDFSEFADTLNLVHTVLYNRLKCKCPTATLDDFKTRFALPSFEFWLAFFTGHTDIPACAQAFPEWDQNYKLVSNLGSIYIDLKGCNYDTFKTTGKCAIQLDLPDYDMALQVAVSRCTDSYLPFISATCKGTGCDKIGLPCNSDSECSANEQCAIIGSTNETLIFEGLKSAYIYDAKDQSPGCYPATQYVEDFFSFFRTAIFGVPASSPFKFSGKPSLDFKMCIPKNLNVTSTFGCTMTGSYNNSVTSCTSLKAWDGILADGTSATSATRLQGSVSGPTLEVTPKLTPSGVPIAYHSAENAFIFFPGGASGLFGGLLTTYASLMNASQYVTQNGQYQAVIDVVTSSVFGVGSMTKVQFKMPFFNQVMDEWFSKNYQVQQCRAKARGGVLSEEDFKVRFAWMIPALTNFLSASDRTFTSPAMSDWFTSFFSQAPFPKLKAPSTCSYQSYLDTRSCAVSFTGLQSLLNSDITLHLLIQDCPDWHLPAVYVECEGKDCQLFTKPQPCSSDAYCSTNFPGTKCLPVTNTLNYDFVQTFFTHALSPIDSCGSSDLLLNDIQTIISHYTKTAVTESGVCFFDVKNFPTDVNQWMTDQYIVDGDSYSIKDLGPWSTDSVEIPGTIKGSSSSSIIFNSWIVMLLMIFFTWKLQ